MGLWVCQLCFCLIFLKVKTVYASLFYHGMLLAFPMWILLFVILYGIHIGLLPEFYHKMLEDKNQWVDGFYAGSAGHKLGFIPITALYSKNCARIKKEGKRPYSN